MKPLNYLLLLGLPALVMVGHTLGGGWNFLVPASCFFIYPLINLFIPEKVSAQAQSQAEPHSSWPYTIVAVCFVPTLLGLTIWSLFAVKDMPMGAAYFGLAISVGIVNGVIGFTLAHEFIHRQSAFGRLCGYALLLQNNYMHYGIEHLCGHHVYACTPEDPHTARAGESLYAYLVRAIKGTFLNAWKIEQRKQRKMRHGVPGMPARLIFFYALQAGVVAAIFFIAGAGTLIFFALQNLFAIFLLHVINYMQHYGLSRSRDAAGRYEKPGPQHAWNTGRCNSALSLFHLESHADHHMHPSRSYDLLRTYALSPQHPLGYSFMVLLAMAPPLWFRVMDNKLDFAKSLTL
jgi:alkane 1-monooxygenase